MRGSADRASQIAVGNFETESRAYLQSEQLSTALILCSLTVLCLNKYQHCEKHSRPFMRL